MKFPTYKEIGEKIAEQALDEYVINGKTLREWIKLLSEQEPKWIPMTTRPMTDEEMEYHREQLEYVDDAVIFNCPLPDDGQEVLITVYGETELDTFYNDAIDGCYFENRDIEDVTAWMPKPKPYDPLESEEICGTDIRTNRKNCEYRHENGNCLKVGGFCTSVDDEHCVKGRK